MVAIIKRNITFFQKYYNYKKLMQRCAVRKIAPTEVVIPFFVGLLKRWQNGI